MLGVVQCYISLFVLPLGICSQPLSLRHYSNEHVVLGYPSRVNVAMTANNKCVLCCTGDVLGPSWCSNKDCERNKRAFVDPDWLEANSEEAKRMIKKLKLNADEEAELDREERERERRAPSASSSATPQNPYNFAAHLSNYQPSRLHAVDPITSTAPGPSMPKPPPRLPPAPPRVHVCCAYELLIVQQHALEDMAQSLSQMAVRFQQIAASISDQIRSIDAAPPRGN